MARTLWGRNAKVYVAPVVYDSNGVIEDIALADMFEVARLKDIGHTDEATDLKATARDLPFAIHAQGEKEVGIEAERLILVNDTGDDFDTLNDAYHNDDEVWVLVTRGDASTSVGDGLLFVGNVFGWTESLPESDPARVTLSLKPSRNSPDTPVAVSTPFTASTFRSNLEWVFDAADLNEPASGKIGSNGESPHPTIYVSSINANGDDVSTEVEAIAADSTVVIVNQNGVQWPGAGIEAVIAEPQIDTAPTPDSYFITTSDSDNLPQLSSMFVTGDVLRMVVTAP